MIQVTIERDRTDRRIVKYVYLGHAHYDDPGKDIVCAGVSSIAFGIVNSIEALLGIELKCRLDESEGRFEAKVPHVTDVDLDDRLQLLLESMVVMIDTIERSYGKYVKLTTKLV